MVGLNFAACIKADNKLVGPLGIILFKPKKMYLSKVKLKYKNDIKVDSKKRWLFPSYHSHITRHTYYNRLKFVAREVNINEDKISPHILRHAFASHMLKNGADLKVLQQLLGHEDISTVEIYTHINIEDTKKALKKHPLTKIDV